MFWSNRSLRNVSNKEAKFNESSPITTKFNADQKCLSLSILIMIKFEFYILESILLFHAIEISAVVLPAAFHGALPAVQLELLSAVMIPAVMIPLAAAAAAAAPAAAAGPAVSGAQGTVCSNDYLQL